MRVDLKGSTRFSFAAGVLLFTPVAVKRRNLRGVLVVALLACVVFATWSWFRPYAWNEDPAARCKVVGVRVKRDESYFWVDIHLKMNAGEKHDLMKPVRLSTSSGSALEPAETTLGGHKDEGTTDMWFKFWLEKPEMDGPLQLRINDGELAIRKGAGMPALGISDSEYFATQRW